MVLVYVSCSPVKKKKSTGRELVNLPSKSWQWGKSHQLCCSLSRMKIVATPRGRRWSVNYCQLFTDKIFTFQLHFDAPAVALTDTTQWGRRCGWRCGWRHHFTGWERGSGMILCSSVLWLKQPSYFAGSGSGIQELSGLMTLHPSAVKKTLASI